MSDGNPGTPPDPSGSPSVEELPRPGGQQRLSNSVITGLGIFLCLFTLLEVNYNLLQEQSALAIFIGVGLVLCYLTFPVHPRLKEIRLFRGTDVLLALASAVCCLYVIVQTEPLFERFWSDGFSLGDRAGAETTTDYVIGVLGVLLVLEATRRSIGLIVPLLAIAFMAHSYYCYGSFRYDWPVMPDWMLPHAGQNIKDIASTTFLQSSGVFGIAARVMFKYVFLFVVFGSFLEMSGATQFIIDFATKTFGRIRGGPAMVSVMASGLMGSLSGSAVANAVTTGTFTIPMMRSARFPNHIAGGITAAAASGGALVPPVMGAGAYMMLELVQPQVTFVTIMKAAILPAVLYYFSILAVVYLYSRRLGATSMDSQQAGEISTGYAATVAVTVTVLGAVGCFAFGLSATRGLMGAYVAILAFAIQKRSFDAVVFASALATLIGLLLEGFSPFRSVTGALAVILVLATLRRTLDISPRARWMAFASFFIVLVLHQFTALLGDDVPALLKPFVAGSWVDPRTDSVAPQLVVASILDSAIVGMFGLLIFGLVHPAWRPEMVSAFTKSAKNGIALVAASACVGIIIGIVQQTGVASDFSAVIKGVVETNLFLALLGIMVCSLILGMGVPSVVCYLLMATLMGSLLGELGVIPLVAHLFIFYFGMMSMVTPPVALAGYASASIAEAPMMKTSFAAFRFALVGFTLPFMFVYRPALCLLAPDGESLTVWSVAYALTVAIIGILALAAGLAGCLRSPMSIPLRVAMFLSAALLLAPITEVGNMQVGVLVDVVGGLIFLAAAVLNVRFDPEPTPEPV